MGVARKLVVYASLTALCLCTVAQAQMYRWTDEEGRVHYSDSPPPEAARQERRVLDERGMTVRTLERAKTREEIDEQRRREEEESRRRAEREEQEHRDRVLLQSFGSERELMTARDDRVALVDSSVSITDEKIRTLEEQAENLERRRRSIEERGREPPADLIEDIGSLRRQIQVQERYREERLEERRRIIEQFDADLQRLRELKAAGR